MGKVTYFKNSPDFDVVKIEIVSENLRRLHEDIKRRLDVKETHSVYNPHCTIAYVEKGEAAQFGGDSFIEGTEIEFKKVVFINDLSKEYSICLG